MSTNLPSSKFLTPDVLALFDELVNDAPNWSGTPLFGGNVADSPANKGHLTALKKAGLVRTWQDEDNRKCHWVSFTDAGDALAKARQTEEHRANLAKLGARVLEILRAEHTTSALASEAVPIERLAIVRAAHSLGLLPEGGVA